MTSLREAAQSYEAPKTLNVADLPSIPVDSPIYEEEGKDRNGKTYRYKYTEFNGKKYRVPNTVLEQIKKIAKIKSDIQSVRVTKTGNGQATKYDVEVVN